MLTMFRFMNREVSQGELEPIVRFRAIDFPETGPASATDKQREALTKAVTEAVAEEARLGQIILATAASTRGIVAVENLAKRGQPDSLVWIV